MAERRPPEGPTREREVIVTKGGGAAGTVIAAVVGVILILVVGWFLLNMLGMTGGEIEEPTNGDVEVEVDTPADLDGGEGDG